MKTSRASGKKSRVPSSLIQAIALLSFLIATLMPKTGHAEPMREFVMSCTYGALAGTLVGAASLAFSDKPGDNLNKVARGASLGLYAGILLGAYVVYGVQGENDEDIPPGVVLREPPRLQVYPLLTERGLEGGAASFSVLRF